MEQTLECIRRDIKRYNFKQYLLENAKGRKYKKHLEDEVLLPLFVDKCFEIINTYQKTEAKEGTCIHNYIEDQLYYIDGNYKIITQEIEEINNKTKLFPKSDF